MTSVVGIDSSLTSTGLVRLRGGYLDGTASVHRVRSKAAGNAIAARVDRLDGIAGEIVRFVQSEPTDLVVIEGPAYGTAGKSGSMHDRSGLWWLVVYSLTRSGFRVLEVPPSSRIKYATGVGGGPNGSKDAVLTAVVRRYPQFEIIGNDQADALLLAVMGRRLLGSPVELTLPQANLAALDKLSLPE